MGGTFPHLSCLRTLSLDSVSLFPNMCPLICDVAKRTPRARDDGPSSQVLYHEEHEVLADGGKWEETKRRW